MTMKAFISHSSIDKPFVERLATDLRTREEIDAWLDKWEILPGDSILAKIEEGLASADVFVIVLSPDSVNSQWVSRERDSWQTAQINEEKRARQESRPPKRLIPVLYKDCEKPPFLNPLLHVSINDENYEQGFQQLVRGMRGESGKPPLKGETTTASVTSLPTVKSSENDLPADPEDFALHLLQRLRPPQFKRVIFYYKLNEYDLPDANASQSEKAMEIVRLAVQQEGESLSKLLRAIDKAMKR
jgi:hypothetical protein